jgi:DNA helicase-2/ATP-dependent DNA helicase PcrA
MEPAGEFGSDEFGDAAGFGEGGRAPAAGGASGGWRAKAQSGKPSAANPHAWIEGLSEEAAAAEPAPSARVDVWGDADGGRDWTQEAARETQQSIAELLAGLTEPQREAVMHEKGPLLIVAAAGSGKTRVITRRIAYLIARGVPAWQILAVTFTNKAAGEMRERVMHVLGGGDSRKARGLTVSTFHALCARLLRRYPEAAGLKPDFAILDSADQSALCKKVIEALQLSTSNFPPRSVLSAISTAKNQLLDPEQFAARATDWSSKNIAKAYSAYERALRQANGVDFDDLLLLTAKLLRKDATARGELQARWRHVMIDEYQDTNMAQFVIASMIAGDGKKLPDGTRVGGEAGPNICVVGDPDQSIYAWRGADISNILEFETHYPGAKVVTLGENFRSTAPILAVADTLIKHNKRRRHKPLFTRQEGGAKIEAVLCRDERHEARLVADWFKSLREGRLAKGQDSSEPAPAWRDMAIFYRTNALSRVMEETLRGAGIPYTIARGTAFYEREEVKTALAYLRLVANLSDDVSLGRVVNTPTRGIGDASLNKVEEFATAQGITLMEGLRRVNEVPDVSSRAHNSMVRFVEMVDGFTGNGTFMGSEITGSLADLVARVLRESGLEAMYKAQANASKNEADEQRLDNLDELVSSARQFELEYDPDNDPAAFPGVEEATRGELAQTPPLLAMLRAFLESVTLVADADAVDPAQGSITMMTLHAAKGLEFKAVAMIGLEENLLPHSRAAESDDALEEERRLAFVGITRAMRRLMMSASRYRTHRGMAERTVPSRFLAELPKEYLAISDQSDTFSDLGGTEWDDKRMEDADQSQVPPPHGATPPGAKGKGKAGPSTPSRGQTRGPAGGPGSTSGLGVKGLGGTPSAPSAPSTPGANLYPVGCRVRHPQFGVGEVTQSSPGVNARVTVKFQGVGVKTLVVEYARLTRVE